MSWHFSQALEAAFSAGNSSDGAPSAPSSGTTTQGASLWQDRTTDASTPFLSGTTCRPSTADRGEELLTWFREAFPVRTYQQQARVQESPGNEAVCGHTWRELWVKFCRDSSSWRTHRCLWVEVLASSSLTLPRWGMMRDGELWERITPGLPIGETGSGLWPTPNKMDALPLILNKSPEKQAREEAFHAAKGVNKQRPLPVAVKQESGMTGGRVNADWIEWLMGWPIEWTDESSDSATDKFRQWSRSHGISCGHDYDDDTNKTRVLPGDS